MTRTSGTSGSTDAVPFRTALRAWLAISLQTFGGPAGQIAVMHRSLVDDKRWIGERRFQHALNYCMLLPGPEAQQLAIYTGWLLGGLRGGLTAGILFVLPGMAALYLLSVLYITFGETTAVAAIFAGLGPAVIAIVTQAVARVAKRALTTRSLTAIALLAFLALTLLHIPFPVVLFGAALTGLLLRPTPAKTAGNSTGHDDSVDSPAPLIPDETIDTGHPGRTRPLRVLLLGLVLWTTPVALVALATGVGSTITTQGLFFSGTALITFGGAYAVLTFVAQHAVETYHWVTANEMVRGLGLAETTPGPLIMVLQFVAFLGAYTHPGDLNPWLAGTIAALLTTWVTFVPSFLFIFLGAPYLERLRANHTLSAAMTGITAAVVGVIASLGVYFATHTLFTGTSAITWGPISLAIPAIEQIRPSAAAITLVALALIFRLRWPVPRTLATCAGLGVLSALAGWPTT
jgi:chromate transporter